MTRPSGGLAARLRSWLGGGGSAAEVPPAGGPSPPESPGERLDAARQRLKETIEAPEEGDADEG